MVNRRPLTPVPSAVICRLIQKALHDIDAATRSQFVDALRVNFHLRTCTSRHIIWVNPFCNAYYMTYLKGGSCCLQENPRPILLVDHEHQIYAAPTSTGPVLFGARTALCGASVTSCSEILGLVGWLVSTPPPLSGEKNPKPVRYHGFLVLNTTPLSAFRRVYTRHCSPHHRCLGQGPCSDLRCGYHLTG